MPVDGFLTKVFHGGMKHMLTGRAIFVLAVCVALGLTACSQKSGKTVVGKWSVDDKTTVTFTSDGKAIDDEKGKIKTGDYFITNGSVLSLKMPDVSNRMEFDVIFPSNDEMLLTKRETRDPAKRTLSAKVEATRFMRIPN